jgi:hypothetical protein
MSHLMEGILISTGGSGFQERRIYLCVWQTE